MLKALITFIFLYLIFRFFLKGVAKKIVQPLESFRKTMEQEQKMEAIQDKIVPCPACGTYNPMKSALEKQGQYYCNKECSEKIA